MGYTTEIHLKERTDSTDQERLFDGWLAGTTNIYPQSEVIMCAMTSHRAIKWACDVEKRAFEWSTAPKISPDGSPSTSTVTTTRIYENFS